MGRSSSTDPGTGITTQIPPNPDAPLNYLLLPAAERMLEAAGPYAQYGSGSRLLPQAAFGQVYAPGPNQTLVGNAFNPAGLQSVYGQSAAPPDLSAYGIQPQPGGAGPNNTTNPFQNLWNGGYQPQQGFGFGWAGGGGFGGQGQGQGGGGQQQQQPQTPNPPAQQQQPQQPPPSSQQPPQQQQQQQPQMNNGAPVAPPPPQFNTQAIGGDPFRIAAGNAPVGANGQPQTLEQMQQLQQMIQQAGQPPAQYSQFNQQQPAATSNPDWAQILSLLQGGK